MANDLKVTISADASKLLAELKKSGVEITNFGKSAEGAAPQSKGFASELTNIQSAAAALGLTAAAAMLVDFGKEAFTAAASAERLWRATENMASQIGSSGDEMVKAITGASQGTISQVNAMQSANKAMMFGLVENSSQMEELTRIAITLGAAMGQDATKSFDNLTTALGRQSPLILDNLGITLNLEQAHKIYADSLGKTVSQLTENEKKQAFVNAALEIGRQKVEELGGVVVDSAGEVEQMSTAWDNFKVAVGGALTEANNKAGVLDFITNGLQGWTFAIQEGIPAVYAQAAAADTATGKMLATATTAGQLSEAMQGGYKNVGLVRQELIASSSSYAAYNAKLDQLTQLSLDSGLGLETMIAALGVSEAEFVSQRAAIAEANTQLHFNTQAANYAAMAQRELAAGTDVATAAAIKNAEAQKLIADAVNVMQAGTPMPGITAPAVDPLTQVFEQSVVSTQDLIDSLNFDKVTGSARNAATDTNNAFQGAFNTIKSAVENQLTPTLNDVWKPPEGGDTFDEDAKRLATVSTDGFASEWLNQLNTQYAGMDWWAPITEAMNSGDSSKLQAAATDILNNNVTALWDIEKIKEGVKQQLQEQNAKQQIMDTIMAELTAEGVVGAQAAAEGQSAAATAGLLGQLMGDPATVASGIKTGLTPAITDLKSQLAGLNGAATEGTEGAADAAAAGGPFGALQTGATNLDTYINSTLKTTIGTVQTTFQTVSSESVIQIGLMTTAAKDLDTGLITVKDTAGKVQNAIVTGMTNGANSITNKLIPAITRATQAFEKMATAARDAARAAGSAGSNAGGAGWGGGGTVNAKHATGTDGWLTVPSGYPNDGYTVGLTSGEKYAVIPPSGFPAAASASPTLAATSGGQSLTIGTLVLQGVQDPKALYKAIEREARANGMQFQRVS